MAELTPGDVLNWDPNIIDQIFQSVTGLHTAHQNLGEGLSDAQRQVADGWHGDGADAFHADVGHQLVDIDQSSQEAQGVATAVQHAEADVRRCHDTMTQIDAQARGNGWTINDDWTITAPGDTATGKEADLENLQAQLTQLRTDATAADQELSLAVRAAVGDVQVDPDGHEIPGGEQPSHDPTIDGPATAPTVESQNTGQQDDLDSSSPGKDIALGGDGKYDYPQIHVDGVNERNPLPVPDGYRPIPTGTAVGPDGTQYGFYALVPYTNPDGSPNYTYTAPDTVVVDLAHPGQALYTLHGISQASGAYDAQTGRMVIAGNTLDGTRALWESAPINQNAAWGNTLQSTGVFGGWMNGNRESQLVALPHGGFMLVGAAESQPIYGATAGTPAGLLTANPTMLVPRMADGQFPYGPTITNIQQVDGKGLVTLRLSTFGIDGYDPRTYTSTFTVTP